MKRRDGKSQRREEKKKEDQKKKRREEKRREEKKKKKKKKKKKEKEEEEEEEEEERRSKKRKLQKKEDPITRKGRKVAKHYVFPMICGSGGSKGRLAEAAGAEPCGQIIDEQLHAVVARNTFAIES